MHWVDRGAEPNGVGPVRSRYTPRWVDFYRQDIGTRPSDARWRDFHDDLREAFFGLCAYCEENTGGEVEHFRPKSKFPQLVYEWSNWVLACHSCNILKGGKWPPFGYVDPCAKSGPARPERFFIFDTLTGEIEPGAALSPGRRKKAVQTIEELRLNEQHHLEKRLEWVELALMLLTAFEDPQSPVTRNSLGWLVARETQLSSITRTAFAEEGYALDDF